jgi:hypothetical protein
MEKRIEVISINPSTVTMVEPAPQEPASSHSVLLRLNMPPDQATLLIEEAQIEGLIHHPRVNLPEVDVTVDLTSEEARQVWSSTRGEIERPESLPPSTNRLVAALEHLLVRCVKSR